MKVTDDIQIKPQWIRSSVSWDGNSRKVRDLLHSSGLNSVCTGAACPNKGECWKDGNITFMILGNICTRACLFCNVSGGKPEIPDIYEPSKIAASVRELGMRYVVVTSVTRDDLPDKGAEQFMRTVKEIKKIDKDVLVELLIPDLGADEELILGVSRSGAEIVGHNIEIPGMLYPNIRPGSDYGQSITVLNVLNDIKKKDAGILVKSSMILGLGERQSDILRTLEDMAETGVDIVYLGQYLSPSRKHWPVKKYYHPEEFDDLASKAGDMGFKTVYAGPMVRSSYRAYEAYVDALKSARS